MISLLQSVVNQGTGIRLRLTYEMENEIAGKTGTTQNQSDGWFMGLTPNLVSGVWVGGEDRSIHFNNIREGQGANMALPIWALYMQRIYNDDELGVTTKDVFEKPDDFSMILDCNQYRKINKEEEYRILDEEY
jgi:penicillin-binding protein 1A